MGDGAAHVRNFAIDGQHLGRLDSEGKVSELRWKEGGKGTVTATLAAWLPEQQDARGAAIAARRLDEKPYWHIERSRIGKSRNVPVELIVNGEVVGKQEIAADGSWKELQWEIALTQSSWVALRVFPSMHTNPIFVHVAGKEIRSNKKSAQWCRDAVEVCWEKKRPLIRAEERDRAEAAYNVAREYYDRAIAESVD